MRESIQELARQLADLGVRHVFGITGSGPTLELITALEHLGATYYPVAHEAAAAIMAGAVTRALDRPALSLSIKGPGLSNMAAGIAANALEGYPALSIAEAYGEAVPAFRRHKRLDQRALLAPLAKGVAGLGSGHAAELLAWAACEPRGPVHLELAEGPIDLATVAPAPAPGLDPAQFKRWLAAAQRPLVIAGSLALRRAWGPRLSRLCLPVMTTVAAKGLLDERGDFQAGVFTGAGREMAPEHALLEQADLVLGLGLRNRELLGFPFPAATLLVDEIGGESGGFPHGDRLLIADEAATQDLLSGLEAREWGRALVAETRTRQRQALLDDSWLPAACFEALNRRTADADLVCDTGSFCTIGEHLFQARPERVFFCSAAGRNMGTGIPTAIGIALARPDRPVFCVAGDGGFAMYAVELKLAAAERVPVCFVLMSDGRYGSIACAPQSHPMSERALSFRAPSWLETVASFGIAGARADSAADFARLVDAWDGAGPFFIECRFEALSYARMTENLR